MQAELHSLAIWPDAPDSLETNAAPPRQLEHEPAEKGFWFLRGVLLLARWEYEVLHCAIADLCAHTQGEDWDVSHNAAG